MNFTSTHQFGHLRPRWSIQTSFWVGLIVVAIAAVSVICVMKRPVWVELEYAAVIVSVVLFIFYWRVLYHGVEFDLNEEVNLRWFTKLWEGCTPEGVDPGVGEFGACTLLGACGGIKGVIIGFFLDIILALFLGIILWIFAMMGLGVLYLAILALAVPLFFVFRQSIHIVVNQAEYCRGKLGRSLVRALIFASAQACLVCLIIFGSHLVATKLGSQVNNSVDSRSVQEPRPESP